MSKAVELQDIPTAVAVKPVLAMVKAFCSNDSYAFKNSALEVAHELELNDKQDLAHYIYAQFGLVRTFEVTD